MDDMVLSTVYVPYTHVTRNNFKFSYFSKTCLLDQTFELFRCIAHEFSSVSMLFSILCRVFVISAVHLVLVDRCRSRSGYISGF